MPIRIALIEDDSEFAATMREYLSRHPGIQIEGVFSSGEAALAQVPALNLDVLLVDINLPKMNGIEFVGRITQSCPSLVCLMLTMYEESSRIFDALKAGACGYLLKRSSSAEIVAAIEEAHAGGSPMTPRIARRVVSFFKSEVPGGKPAPGCEELTERERELLELMSKGNHYKEIATQLGISTHTVNSHLRRIYEKLHVSSRSQAVAKYKGLGE